MCGGVGVGGSGHLSGHIPPKVNSSVKTEFQIPLVSRPPHSTILVPP